MKILILIYLISEVTSTNVQNKSNVSTNSTNSTSNLYINNWSQYELPVPVDAVTLKKILHRVSLFRLLKYCPFEGEDGCQKRSMKAVVAEIIRKTKEEQESSPQRLRSEYVFII